MEAIYEISKFSRRGSRCHCIALLGSLSKPMTTTTTRTSPNKKLDEQNSSCRRLMIQLCTFLCRPLQNNNVKWPSSASSTERGGRRLIFRIKFHLELNAVVAYWRTEQIYAIANFAQPLHRHSRCRCNRRFLKPPDVYLYMYRQIISKRSDAWVKRFVPFINIVHAYANWICLRGSPSYVITLFRLHHFEALPALYGHSGTHIAALTRNHECRWWWGQLRNMTSLKRQL